MSKIDEKIVVVRPFAYLRLWSASETRITIETKNKEYETKHIFWRLYWIGFP